MLQNVRALVQSVGAAKRAPAALLIFVFWQYGCDPW